MKKRLVGGLVLALAVSSLLGGCGEKATTSEKPETGKTKIRFATWDTAGDVDKQQAMVDKFNAEHDDIEVTMEAYGQDFDTKISAGMGSGDAPDVMYMWNYPAYHEGLEPLDSYIEKEGQEYKDNIYEALWPYNSIDGATYGIPVGFTTHVLFYNKDLFAQAGVEEPTADWTWDDLREAAKTIADNTDAKGLAFSMKPDPYDFEMFLWSNGAAYCDAEGKLEGNLNSEKSKEVFQMFQDMEKEGYAVATEKSGTDEFRSQQAAMYIYGAWSINDFKADGLNFGLVDIPAFKDAATLDKRIGQPQAYTLRPSATINVTNCKTDIFHYYIISLLYRHYHHSVSTNTQSVQPILQGIFPHRFTVNNLTTWIHVILPRCHP